MNATSGDKHFAVRLFRERQALMTEQLDVLRLIQDL
jgi:hypothetical protein